MEKLLSRNVHITAPVVTAAAPAAPDPCFDIDAKTDSELCNGDVCAVINRIIYTGSYLHIP